MIETWLTAFKDGWKSHDIDAVMALFVDSVEYWETPFQKVESMSALRREWHAILSQSNIKIDTKVYSSSDNHHTIIWDLQYLDEDSQPQHLSGTYLITLNHDGLCRYFYQTGEKV
ncbi:MAG: nuclear transport factor 2 family protein [Candidatus Saccharimonadales bacterium]|jgi:ketosteroid isomerase-like protein